MSEETALYRLNFMFLSVLGIPLKTALVITECFNGYSDSVERDPSFHETKFRKFSVAS